ncbi:MAG: PKD domain-containing protein [Thermoplasmata archaeon]|nr:PKD domain-containing protein [Thermoplasmata archaeon]
MRGRTLVSLAIVTLLVLGFPVTFGQAWDGTVNFTPYTVYQGETTQFTVKVNEERGDSTDIYWVTVNFCWMSSGFVYYFKDDDGSKVSMSAHGSRSFSEYITVSQSSLGSCTVKVKVHAKAVGDWWAETSTFSTSINVKSIPPLQVSASGNPNSGDAPLTVHFSTSVSGGLTPYSYSWTFGDGSSSSQKSPTHTYSSPGTYTAKVTVRDDAWNEQTKSDSITVHVSESSSGGGGSGGGSSGDDSSGDGYTATFGSGFLVLLVILLIVAVVVAVALKGRKKRPAVHQAYLPQETYSAQHPYQPEQTEPSEGQPPGF